MMRLLLTRWLIEDDGQDLVEYVLLGATIAFVGLVTMNAFDDVIHDVYASWESGTQAVWEPQDPQ
jgi:Flp pilus assembly pilin Flp